ncbi:MAG: ATP-binding protein [Calothrix sp. MO_192.B10]|nr:ATP-binding protein [Calothrix sp. MO_192.B10]
MEKLTVINFLNIEDIELNLAKINILIGPQASGKSIIAKLIYFFKDFFLKYRSSILRQQNKADFDKNIIKNFKEIFPEYSWKEQKFNITYHLNDYYVCLYTKELANNKYKLSLEYSEHLVKSRRKIFAEYKKRSKTLEGTEKNKDYVRDILKYFNAVFDQYILQENEVNRLDPLTFIPAGRSFFANLQNNIFSFLSEDVLIDYFLKEFGSDYEQVKQFYQYREIYTQRSDAIDELMNKIIVGNYVYEKGEDWIYNHKNNKRINLSNSSSGQQEALPMLMILAVLPFLDETRFFIIEEPEAHLFPQSQKYVINLISLIFNLTDKRHKFLITTHSPYILTAFNNLIQAGNTLQALKNKSDNSNLIQKLMKIVPKNQMLDINDIGAYTIKDGRIESIINQENQLIDANVIDEISNELSEEFDQLLELELGE